MKNENQETDNCIINNLYLLFHSEDVLLTWEHYGFSIATANKTRTENKLEVTRMRHGTGKTVSLSTALLTLKE